MAWIRGRKAERLQSNPNLGQRVVRCWTIAIIPSQGGKDAGIEWWTRAYHKSRSEAVHTNFKRSHNVDGTPTILHDQRLGGRPGSMRVMRM